MQQDRRRQKNHVKFCNRNKRKQLLQGSIKLKDIQTWQKTYINLDYTKAEQEQQYMLQNELRKKREQEPGKSWKIQNYNGQKTILTSH